MLIEKVKINELISPDYNPRKIDKKKLDSLKKSLNEFGYVDPLIVNKYNNHIVGGNQRWIALKELGYKEVDVIFINEPDINREKALNIRLNNNSGIWDNDKLNNLLSDLDTIDFDLSLTGFDDFKVNFDNVNFNNTDNLTFENNIADNISNTSNEEISSETTSENYQQNENNSFNDMSNNIDDEDDPYENYIIPEDEPEFDESIINNMDIIICPRCGYELPKH